MRFQDSVFHRILADELAGLADPAAALPSHAAAARAFLAALPEAKAGHAYAPGKWTVAEVVGHLCDTQVVFLGRLLHIARGPSGPLPGFDEQAWIAASGHGSLPLAALRELHGRGLALAEALVATLPPGALDREGNANGIDITAGEVLRYLVAHERHHFRVLRERYLGP